ncbi:MAG: NeuD/PglB/VioB family sugar acetyltransferase [Magnetococcus sp. YQC-9]
MIDHSFDETFMHRIVMIGSSGHAKSTIDVIEKEKKYVIAGLVDSFCPIDQVVLGYPVIGRVHELSELSGRFDIHGVFIAIGDNAQRAIMADKMAFLIPEIPMVTTVHPSAQIGLNTKIGEGTVIMAGAVIGPNCTVGRGCIINTLASLDHDSVMEDYSSLAPHAATGGTCRIGTASALGIGAKLIHGITVGNHVVVGAGAVVLQNIGHETVAYGTPARIVRTRKPGDPYL